MTADDELRRLAEAATPGPWRRAATEDTGWAVHRGGHDTVALYADRDDAEFIAAANPTAVLALLDRLRAAEEAVARVEAVHAEYFDLDREPFDEASPEPEDVWRFDRDLRAALGDARAEGEA